MSYNQVKKQRAKSTKSTNERLMITLMCTKDG